jgi:hypothetical protein
MTLRASHWLLVLPVLHILSSLMRSEMRNRFIVYLARGFALVLFRGFVCWRFTNLMSSSTWAGDSNTRSLIVRPSFFSNCEMPINPGEVRSNRSSRHHAFCTRQHFKRSPDLIHPNSFHTIKQSSNLTRSIRAQTTDCGQRVTCIASVSKTSTTFW